MTNDSDVPSHETKVEHKFPGTVRIVGASPEGEAADGQVTWDLGTLNPHETRALSVTYSSNEIGSVEGVTTARGHCARVAEARAVTAFKGVPAILVEVVDSPDPVESDMDAAVYKIRVTNQGTVKLTNVKVDCLLEGAEGEADGEGATEGRAAGSRMDFAPVAELEPNERAEWTVTMKTRVTADARFKVKVDADQIDTPVEEEESTHFVR